MQQLKDNLRQTESYATFPEMSPITEIIHLDLEEIRRDGGTQPRVKMELHHIKRLEDQIEDGQELEPIVVFYDGEFYWLADGFHRWIAHFNQGEPTIRAMVHQGTRRLAVLYSVGANADHKPALPRNRADKQRAVLTLLHDPEWEQWSDREIARQCKVSDRTVNRLRHSICDNDADTKVNTIRKVKRGETEYTVDTTNIGKSQIESSVTNRVTITGGYFSGQSGTISQMPNPRQAIVALDTGERELIQLRHLVKEGTTKGIMEVMRDIEVEPEYNNSNDDDSLTNSKGNPPVVVAKRSLTNVADTTVEVNTDDILIAFISNLEYMSEAQIKAAVQAISNSYPEMFKH